MDRLWAAMVSLRTTAILLVVLASLLVLNVVIPQEATSPEGYAALTRSGPAARFLLVTAGLGRVATSAPFLATLALFFINLSAVLLERVGVTLRRMRFNPPSLTQLQPLLGGSLELAVPDASASADRVQELLQVLGYRTHRVAEGALWGVKHRFALAGFPVFHGAFFLMAAGGLLLFYSRDVVTILAAEGQTVSSASAGVVRRAPWGAPPPVALTVHRVDAKLEQGRPVALGAELQLEGPGGSRESSSVNHPAVWGDLTVLTEAAGIAPVLWLVDRSGFTIDRVAVLVAGQKGQATRVSFLDGGVEVAMEPVRLGTRFPARDALPSTPVSMTITERGKEVFAGLLRPGEAVDVGGATLKLQEVRYWAALRLVTERGGGWLVSGFLLSIVGIVWRMTWHRREVAVSWGEGRARIGGRSEFYPWRFQEELARLKALIEAEVAKERDR